MALISVITPCFNEKNNVRALAEAVRIQMESVAKYDFEHIFIDNASTDGTIDELRLMAASDSRIKVILNVGNYGHSRSPHHAMKQASGDAVIGICADFQDPPDLVPQLIKKWEDGFKVVAAVKQTTQERGLLRFLRRAYYRLLSAFSSIPLINDFTGFGLYDRRVIDIFKSCRDEEIYFRGFVAELGFPIAYVSYHQPVRRSGESKNSFKSLIDFAISGFVAYGSKSIRVLTISGFSLSVFSMAVAVFYFLMKLFYWDSFEVGLAPLLIGLFFFASVQIFVLGIIGEYVSAVIDRVRFRPPVVEAERINFTNDGG